ncbi:hypothetical protein [Microvirga vignae]|nr:hypothetical protein [Microvirga vignae]
MMFKGRNIYAYLLWMVRLAVILLRGGDAVVAIEARGRVPGGAGSVDWLR